MNCQQASEKLLTYLDDELREKDKRSLEVHLQTCSTCQQKLEALQNTRGIICRDFEAVKQKTVPAWLWMELQQRLEVSVDKRPFIFNKIIDRVQALFSRQPRWKLVLSGIFLTALIAGSSILIPWVMRPPNKVLASQIAINTPEVRALSGGTPQVEAAEVAGNTGYILSQGASGESNLAYVDMRHQSVSRLFRLAMPPLTEDNKTESLNIARANPQVEQILGNGGVINTNDIFSLTPRLRMDIINGQPVIWSEGVQVGLVLKQGDMIWLAKIDLAKGQVAGIYKVSQSSPVQVTDNRDAYYSQEINAIAEADKRVSVLLHDGAVIDHIAVGGGDMASKGAMILKMGDEIWSVRVNLRDHSVTGVYPVPEAKYSRTNLFSPE